MCLIRKIGLLARFFVLFVLVSCKIGEDEKKLKLTYEVDTLSITIDESQLLDYPYSSIFKSDSIDYFFGYNRPLHRIDIFSLNDGAFTKSIILQNDGPDALDQPFDFFVQDLDSIFYYSNNYSLNILNQKGELIGRNILTKKSDFVGKGEYRVGYLSQPVNLKLFFDSKSNSVFFHSYSMESGSNKKEYYQVPILTEIGLESKVVKEYPFHFPSSYLRDGEYLGEYMNPNIVVEDSLIIFSYPDSPEINVYNRKTENLISKRIESKKTRNSVNYLPSEAHSEMNLRLNHLIENPYFHKTVFDPYRNLFYRIHRGEHPNPDIIQGNYNLSYTRDYLTVLDKNLNLLQEIELPANTYNALSFFVTREGLFLPYSHYLNPNLDESKLVFHTYKFKVD
jgi:hypothetical protein